jgi:hypothetical protein
MFSKFILFLIYVYSRILLHFQTRHQLEKLLDWENSHLYNKLGLKWKLSRQRCDSTLMMEYVSPKLGVELSYDDAI